LKKIILIAVLCAATTYAADVAQPASVQEQIAAMQENIRQMQTLHEQEIAALKKQIADQQTMIDALQKTAAESSNAPPLPSGCGENLTTPMTGAPIPSPAPSAPMFPTTDESVVASSVANPTGSFPTSDPGIVSTTSIGGSPITIAGGGKSYLNISFDGLFTAAASTARDLNHIEVGDHDPHQRGFNARNEEIALDGAVDPYFEGFANIVFKLNDANETEVEVEEAFMQTTSLPFGLQIKGGQFFTAFGRINPNHPHTWDFADAPLVHGRLLGSDGLRGVGLQLAWVVPLPWYSQLLLAVQNGNGNTGFSFRNTGDGGIFFGRQTIDRPLRGPNDLLFVPRWENSFDLSLTRTLLVGLSGAFGPNDTGAHSRTQILGADAFYKWKPANAEGGWPFVKWQSEVMYRRFEAARGLDDTFPVAETFNDWGAYSQVIWGFSKGWTAGVRGDYLHVQNSRFTDDEGRQSRSRLSADLTFFPSEFSKIRLQYNHDFLEPNHFLDDRQVDSVFLQFEFALGAHGAHKF
jgi:hypothetical protein